MVSVAPTLQCNLQCKTCGFQDNLTRADRQPAGTRFDRIMSREQLMDVAEQLRALHTSIQISGGEPTLHPDLIQFIRNTAGDNHLLCDLMTNGLHLGDLGDDLLTAGLNSIHISVDGTGDAYNAVRGAGVFRRLDQSLTRFFQLKHQQTSRRFMTVAVFTVTPDNQADLVQTAGYVMALGFDQLLLLHPVSIDAAQLRANNAVMSDPRDHALWTWGERIDLEAMDIPALKASITRVRQLISRYPGRSFRSNPDLDTYGYDRFYARKPIVPEQRHPCPAFYLHCVIYPDGSVMPSNGCYFQPLGNVFETPLRKIWNNAAYRGLRRRVRRNGYIPLCTFCFIAYNACL